MAPGRRLAQPASTRRPLYRELVTPRARRVPPNIHVFFKGNLWPGSLADSGSPQHTEGRMPVIPTQLHPGTVPHDLDSASPKVRERCPASSNILPAHRFDDSVLRWGPGPDPERISPVRPKPNPPRLHERQGQQSDLGNPWGGITHPG